MKISYLVHGFPPRENAGTEQHTASLVKQLQQRGHQVQVIAATRAPGRPHAEVFTSRSGCHHIVNNIPARPLAHQECDSLIRKKIQTLLAQFQPDLVHIQHLQFLSADIQTHVPTIFTFHDSWAWCPAGGLELRWPSKDNCETPTPKDCAHCSALWHPQLSPNAHRLIDLASFLNPIISSERLHRLWQRLPHRIRAPLNTERGIAPPPPESVVRRNHRLQELINSCELKISPSQFLADRAMERGISNVKVLPHGTDERLPHLGGGGILFLGTLSHHKGADLVAKAIQQAFPVNPPPSRFYGQAVDPEIAQAVGAKPPLNRPAVWKALQKADVLVMGSRWRENAPLVILEARAAGCPIIAPRIGGIPELVKEGVDGFLFEANNINACADALKRWSSSQKMTPRPPPTAKARMDMLEAWYQQLHQ